MCSLVFDLNKFVIPLNSFFFFFSINYFRDDKSFMQFLILYLKKEVTTFNCDSKKNYEIRQNSKERKK
jgi:hypothetical protein